MNNTPQVYFKNLFNDNQPHFHDLSGLSLTISHVMLGLLDNPYQSHFSSGLSLTISHVMLGFSDNLCQFHGLSRLSLTISHVMLGFPDNHPQFQGRDELFFISERVTSAPSSPVSQNNKENTWRDCLFQIFINSVLCLEQRKLEICVQRFLTERVQHS